MHSCNDSLCYCLYELTSELWKYDMPALTAADSAICSQRVLLHPRHLSCRRHFVGCTLRLQRALQADCRVIRASGKCCCATVNRAAAHNFGCHWPVGNAPPSLLAYLSHNSANATFVIFDFCCFCHELKASLVSCVVGIDGSNLSWHGVSARPCGKHLCHCQTV